MNRRNYQRELEAVIKENESKSRVPRLLLHSCCAPCSSYVLEYLSDYFEITVFYYNPNISPAEEYEKRAAEQQHLIRELPAKHPITLVVGAYEPERFYAVSRGLRQFRRVENAVFGVTDCVWKRLLKWRRRAVLIILPRLLPSVRLRMPANSMRSERNSLKSTR